jgi:hypothetical protein
LPSAFHSAVETCGSIVALVYHQRAELARSTITFGLGEALRRVALEQLGVDGDVARLLARRGQQRVRSPGWSSGASSRIASSTSRRRQHFNLDRDQRQRLLGQRRRARRDGGNRLARKQEPVVRHV